MKYQEIKSKTKDELNKYYVDYKKKLYNKIIAQILTRLEEIKNA